MTDIDTLVVRTLAGADALLLPIRQWTRNHSANREHGLQMLKSHGVPLRVGGDGDTRKTGERTIAEAAEKGLITVSRQGMDRYPYLKLTPFGHAHARALTYFTDDDLDARAVARLMLLALVKYGKFRRAAINDLTFVPEILLNSGRGWDGDDTTRKDKKMLGTIEIDYCVAACLGWMTCCSAIRGHVAYAITAAGKAELDNPSPVPDFGTMPAFTKEAARLYERERDAKLSDLAAAEIATTGEIGPLPAIECLLGVSDEERHFFFPETKVGA
jgi:hypothetical protein